MSHRSDRRAAERATVEAQYKRALEYWFELSGTTMSDLEEWIERLELQSRTRGLGLPGLPAEIVCTVSERIKEDTRVLDHGRVVIWVTRAMQHAAIRVTSRMAAAQAQRQLSLW